MFVILDLERLTNDKYSSLLRKTIIYGQKKFYNIGPRLENVSSLIPISLQRTDKTSDSFPETFMKHHFKERVNMEQIKGLLNISSVIKEECHAAKAYYEKP